MNRKIKFGVIGAMESEIAQLRDALSGAEKTDFSGLTFYKGTLGENEVVLVKSGVGKVNAARCAQILIDRFAVDYIINTGIAGGIGEGLAVGDIVIGTETLRRSAESAAAFLPTAIPITPPSSAPIHALQMPSKRRLRISSQRKRSARGELQRAISLLHRRN